MKCFCKLYLGKLAHIISVPEYSFYKFGKDPMEGAKKSLWGAISMCTLQKSGQDNNIKIRQQRWKLRHFVIQNWREIFQIRVGLIKQKNVEILLAGTLP